MTQPRGRRTDHLYWLTMRNSCATLGNVNTTSSRLGCATWRATPNTPEERSKRQEAEVRAQEAVRQRTH
jgi:hypothetical protein